MTDDVVTYHADAGMFRKVIVEGGPERAETAPSVPDEG